MEHALLWPLACLILRYTQLDKFQFADATVNSLYPIIYTHTCPFFTLSLQSLDLALKYCNYFFTSMFVLEAVLKLIAFGVRRFFKDRYSACFYFL